MTNGETYLITLPFIQLEDRIEVRLEVAVSLGEGARRCPQDQPQRVRMSLHAKEMTGRRSHATLLRLGFAKVA